MYTEQTRYALGRMIGGTQGAELCAQAEATLLALGVADPARFLGSSFPELRERS
jgi:hypothetical protein